MHSSNATEHPDRLEAEYAELRKKYIELISVPQPNVTAIEAMVRRMTEAQLTIQNGAWAGRCGPGKA